MYNCAKLRFEYIKIDDTNDGDTKNVARIISSHDLHGQNDGIVGIRRDVTIRDQCNALHDINILDIITCWMKIINRALS